MVWADKNIAGKNYVFSHLNPFIMQVTPKAQDARTYKVFVSFGLHCFSREWVTGDPDDHKFPDGRGERCFCPIRYGQSLQLPDIIRKSVTGRVFFSQNLNYLIIENLTGLRGPYAIFFNVEKARSKEFDVAMFVVSAYEKPNLPKNLPKITFATLIGKTSRGERMTRP